MSDKIWMSLSQVDLTHVHARLSQGS